MVRRMRRLLIMFVSWLLIIGHLGATLSLQGSCLPAWPPISPHFPQFGTQTAKNEAVGLYYLRARYMNTANGRFWNADSYEGAQSDPRSLHKYLYCGGDPINRTDPSGNWSLVEIMISTGIVAMRVAPTVVKYSAYTAFAAATVYFFTGALIGIEDAYFDGAPEYLYTFRDIAGDVLFIAAFLNEAASGIAPPNFRDSSRVPTKKIYVSPKRYPQSANHIQDAQKAGKPTIVRAQRNGSVENRILSLRGTKTVKGQDRDEYPPAMFEEGGTGASVRHIDPSDNRGSGASIGYQMRDVLDGDYVEIVVGEPPES